MKAKKRAAQGAHTYMPAAFLLAGLLISAYSQQIPKGWRQFTSVASGYTAHYPPHWSPLFPDEPSMEIVNFPPSKRVKAVILPANGALINIVRPPKSVATTEQWIEYHSAATGVQSKNTLLLPRASQEPIKVTEVVLQPIEGQETVFCYFELAGRLLEGHVTYWKGDPNAAQHLQVLHDVIENIKPLAQ